MHSLLIALATPAPTPSPSLRPGVSQDQVTPGLLGFLLTAFIVVLTALLIVDMVRRIRRVRYRAQVEEERAEAALSGGAATLPGAASPEVQDQRGQHSAGAAGNRPEADGDAGPGSR